MRPRNRLARRLALPLAIVMAPAPQAGAGPIVAQTVVPAEESSTPSAPQPKPKEAGKGDRIPGRPENGAALPASPPRGRAASLEVDDRSTSGLVDPSVPRATDEGKEGNEFTPTDQVPSSTQGLPPSGSHSPNPEPGDSGTYAGQPSGTTGAAVGEVGSPIGPLIAVPLPRGPEEVSAPRTPDTLASPGIPTTSAPVSRPPDSRETVPAAPAPATDRGAGDLAPALQVPQVGDATASPSTSGATAGSPGAANAPLGSTAAGSTVRGSGGAGPASAEPSGGTSGLAGTAPPLRDPGGAKPAGIATEAGASSRSTGVPPDSQTAAVANAPAQVSGGSGGTITDATQGSGVMSSMDKATAFGQLLTTAVLAQELTSTGRTGGGGTQVEPSADKSPLVMSDRALLAQVGGATPLDVDPGASGDVGGVDPRDPVGGTTEPSAPSVTLAPDLPLPAVDAGEGAWQRADPGITSGTPLSPSISPVAIPEPTPLVQVVVVLAGSAIGIARRRLRVRSRGR